MGALAACGGSDEPRVLPPDPATEQSDRPVKPPRGWRTVENASAGFTIAVPREWRARTRRGATLLRSPDRLMAVSLAADRSEPGREFGPAEYAQQTLAAVPGFRRKLKPRRAPAVDGSPYPTAAATARGTLRRTRVAQHVSAFVFQRRGRVSYVAIAFRSSDRRSRPHARTLVRMLRTLRVQAPRQRSGRSG